MTSGASSSTSSFSTSIFTYDVFLSFRGEDTRFGFTGNLYAALDGRGINAFIDDQQLRKGNEIRPSLVKAIEESRIAIVVLSKNYASSSFCLDELAKIMDCFKGRKSSLVIPVFYDVDPSHVRKQTGTLGEALAAHENNFKANMEHFNDNMERLRKWRMALKQVADISGYHFKCGHGYEHKFIAKIVHQVSRVIRRVALPFVDYPVGLDSQVKNVTSLLDVGSKDGVRILAIHGIGGIGKTTLAVAVYNWIVDCFEDLTFKGICFLENIRENSTKHGLQHLQKIVLSELVGEKEIELTSVKEGISKLKQRLQREKILLILDDVDQHEQLEALAGKSNWFGHGSKVIVTTRDISLLSRYEHKITYELETLNKKDTLELLSWKALKTNRFDPSYMDVLNEVVTYTSGLPLALEVIGSNLTGKSVEEWKSALNQYKSIPNKKIQSILKVSFDALEEFEKEIFLDIVCCLKAYELKDVKEILCAHHGVVNVEYGLGVLIEKSLLKIQTQIHRSGYWVTSHDLIQDMGREIIRQESPKNPGRRSRLWHLKDIAPVFEKNMGTDKIEMIYMDFSMFKKVIKWDGEAFKKTTKIRTLIIRQARFSQGPKQLPNTLRVLKWQEYPSPSLPLGFHPEELVVFHLRFSSLMSVEFLHKQKFKSLTVIKLDWSDIEEIPDVSGVPNLIELSFWGCNNLIKVHESIGFLDKLQHLYVNHCPKLRSFPPIKLTNIAYLNFRFCFNLENFPEVLGKMESLSHICLRGTLIKELPSSITNLTKLRSLSIESWGMFQLPSCIVMLPCLEDVCLSAPEGLQFSRQDEEEQQRSSMLSSNTKVVDFTKCNMSNERWPVIVAWFRNVVKLTLDGNNFTVLPESIRELCSLRYLSLTDCKKLREIRGIPPNMAEFFAGDCVSMTSSSKTMLLNEELHEDGNKLFRLPGSIIPEWFEHSSKQDSISFWFRNKLPEICLCLIDNKNNNNNNSDNSWGDNIYKLIINGNKLSSDSLPARYLLVPTVEDHITIFGLRRTILDHQKVDKVCLENEWNHVVCSFSRRCAIKQIGMHVVKHKSSLEDIRFINPLYEELNKGDLHKNLQLPTDLPSLETPHCQQLPLHHPLAENSLKDNVSATSLALVGGIASTTNVEGPCLNHLCTLRLGLDYEGVEPPCNDASLKVDSHSDSIMSSSLPSDAASKGGSDDDLWRYGMTLSLRPCGQALLDCDNWNLSLMQSASAGGTIRDEDQGCGNASRKRRRSTLMLNLNDKPSNAESFYRAPSKVDLDSDSTMFSFAENKPSESSQALPSKIAAGEELHQRTYCTVLPTTNGDSFRIQIDPSQDDDVEMEKFYSSLESVNHVPSCSHDHTANMVPNEEAREALKIVQEFITNNDASVFLDLEQCSIMKTSLDFLSNLSANGDLSREARALVSEASRVFTHCNSNYIEANMKIEFGASELLRADELEADLENNKSQFKVVAALEKEQNQKLASLEESKKELEKQISAINANISVFQSEQNMTRKRKRDIFEEGKTLKTQVDKLKEKVSYLRHEQDLAKETQVKIKAEWSGLREKFRKIVVE